MVFEIKRVERCPWHNCRLIIYDTPEGRVNTLCESFLIKNLKMTKEMVDKLIEEGSMEKLVHLVFLTLVMAKLKKPMR